MRGSRVRGLWFTPVSCCQPSLWFVVLGCLWSISLVGWTGGWVWASACIHTSTNFGIVSLKGVILIFLALARLCSHLSHDGT